MKKTLLISYFLFNVAISFAEKGNHDKLLQELKNETNESRQIELYNKLFLAEEFTNPKLAEKYLSKALVIATRKNDIRGLGTTWIHFGFFSEDKAQFPEAIKFYNLALDAYKKIKDTNGIADVYNSLGVVNWYLGNYPEATHFTYSALKIFESQNDSSGISSANSNLGLLFSEQKNYSKAAFHTAKALAIQQKLRNPSTIANSFTNMGLIYSAQKDLKKALQYYEAARIIKDSLNDKAALSVIYNNIATTQIELMQFDEALVNLNQSISISEKSGDTTIYCIAIFNKGNVFYKQNKFAEAAKLMEKSLQISRMKGYKENLKSIYYIKAGLDSVSGNFKFAFENYKSFVLYRDSLDNEESRKSILQKQLTYDFEKKEAITRANQLQKDIKENEEKRRQKIILTAVSTGLILLFILFLLVFKNYKEKQRSNRIISEQKKEVEKQKDIVEEKQKEIIDSITYAGRLQKAILPPPEFLSENKLKGFIFYKPKDIVAGDFYWMEKTDDYLFIAAADCTGHGVPGAMVSVVCSNALNQILKEKNIVETNEILDKASELIIQTFDKSGEIVKDGMDISLLRINRVSMNTETVQIQWSGANNPLWYFMDGNELIEVKGDKMPVGNHVLKNTFKAHNLNVTKNSIFYLITDGYADQFGGEEGKKLMNKKLKLLLSEIHTDDTATQQDELNNSFLRWKGNRKQIDDVTIIGISLS